MWNINNPFRFLGIFLHRSNWSHEFFTLGFIIETGRHLTLTSLGLGSYPRDLLSRLPHTHARASQIHGPENGGVIAFYIWLFPAQVVVKLFLLRSRALACSPKLESSFEHEEVWWLLKLGAQLTGPSVHRTAELFDRTVPGDPLPSRSHW